MSVMICVRCGRIFPRPPDQKSGYITCWDCLHENREHIPIEEFLEKRDEFVKLNTK
ncbi:MAG: hypothetical protein ACXQTD_09650 [Candidatus Syntropharchaeia archaeon]